MICVMEKKSQDSIEGDNYLPRKYREWKKEGNKRSKTEEKEEVTLPDELESMMKEVGDEDIGEIAGDVMDYWCFEKHFSD